MPSYDISQVSDDATVTVNVSPAQAVFEIRSSRQPSAVAGIGRAAFQQVDGPAPQRVSIHLYLRGLEELRFTYADVEIRVSVPSSAADMVLESLRLNGGDEVPITPASPYWMNVEIVHGANSSETTFPLEGGFFQVDAPAAFTDSHQREFSIAWIDFFR